MIPFLRSLNELMIITQEGSPNKEIREEKDFNSLNKLDDKKETQSHSQKRKVIKLPSLPRNNRYKWIKGKEAVYKFFDELDYNNQIQSTYDLTLIDRLKNYDNQDVA